MLSSCCRSPSYESDQMTTAFGSNLLTTPSRQNCICLSQSAPGAAPQQRRRATCGVAHTAVALQMVSSHKGRDHRGERRKSGMKAVTCNEMS